MQVTELSAEGLKRQYKVVLPAADLASKLDAQIADMKGKVRINGFRPGKVPAAHLKRLYGRSIMGDVVQNAVNEANRKIVEDNHLRLALEPKIDIAGDQAEVEKAMDAKGDLAFTVALETLPQFEVGTFDDIELERQVADVDDAEIEKAVQRMAEGSRTYTDKADENPDPDAVTSNAALVPLGTPLLAGPGAIVAAMVAVESASTPLVGWLSVTAAILCTHIIIWVTLRFSVGLHRLLGESGIRVLTRIFGLLLAAIAVQMMGDGVHSYITTHF